jgi:hypothetical protein
MSGAGPLGFATFPRSTADKMGLAERSQGDNGSTEHLTSAIGACHAATCFGKCRSCPDATTAVASHTILHKLRYFMMIVPSSPSRRANHVSTRMPKGQNHALG